MKILNNTVVTTPIAHMCEFPENLIISGNVYTKSPLHPLSMRFAMIEDPDSSILLKDTYEILDTTNPRYRDHKDTYVEDEYNEGVVWLFYNENNVFRATPNEFGYEITKLTEVMEPDATVTSPLTPGAGVYFSYAFQTKDFIYCWWHNGPDNTNHLGAIDKQTMIWHKVTSASLHTGYVEPIGYYYDELNDIYYHYYLGYNYTITGTQDCFIYSLNLNTKVKTQVWNYRVTPSSYYTYNRITPKVMRQNNDCGILYVHKYYNNANGYRYMYKYVISEAAKITVTRVYYEDDYYNAGTILNYKYFFFHPQNNIISCCLIDTSGTNNMNCFHNDKLRQDIDFNDIKNIPDTSYASNYTTQTTVINNIHPKILTCGSIENDKIIFFVSKTKISIWKWNESTLQYELTNEVEDNLERVGVDFNENIWIRNTDKEVYTINTNFTDYEITISADTKDFDYLGKNITSNIKVKALNKNGVHISCRIKLKITGSAKFAQNHSKELELELPGQELEIPIIIYDTGIIHIAAIS